MKNFAAFFLIAGCAAAPEPSAPVTGEWGGTHVELRLTPAGGALAYDCAAGTIGPIIVDARGNFTADGTHTPGHGGPVRQGEVLRAYPAHYRGTVRGNRMMLSGQLDNGVELGPFSLERGAQAQLFRCL